MRANIYIYPWDLEEEGIELVASHLMNAGISGVSVASSYHAGKFIRPHAPRQKVFFPQDGVIYFKPDFACYGRIKPRVADSVANFDSLRELERHAPNLERTGWTVGLHNTALGMQYRDLTARTVFGDPLLNSLCPSQPDVRQYLCNLCSDLASNYSLDELLVETPGWQTYRHGYHHEVELIELSSRVEIMLGICFCTECCARAESENFDIQKLAERSRAELEAFFVDGTEPRTDPLNDPEWEQLHEVRVKTVLSLVREIRASVSPDVPLAIIPTTQSPNSLCKTEGSDLRQLADITDRLEILCYQISLLEMSNDLADVKRVLGTTKGHGYALRPTYPQMSNAQDVREATALIRDAGAESISFYNYGHMRLQSLDWIRSSISTIRR